MSQENSDTGMDTAGRYNACMNSHKDRANSCLAAFQYLGRRWVWIPLPKPRAIGNCLHLEEEDQFPIKKW